MLVVEQGCVRTLHLGYRCDRLHRELSTHAHHPVPHFKMEPWYLDVIRSQAQLTVSRPI